MCTATTYRSQDFYFGRTFDYEFNYGEEVTVTPRNYPFPLRHQNALTEHYAMIGIAHMAGDYPLYYDAVNEKGLGMAGLNFPGNAVYSKVQTGKDNIAQFEFIPWILGQCANVQEARVLLSHINLVDTPFNEKYPVSPLHWILADKEEAITIESVQEGLKIYDNPVGVLTNNPPFPIQMFRLNDYMSLSSESPTNRFSADLKLKPYSRGMGAMGLPGDLSSASRFVRVAFTKMNSLSGLSEITIYTSCCNADRGIYYYTTYENHQITAVDMYRENLDSDRPVHYPLVQGEHILLQNAAAGSAEENQ